MKGTKITTGIKGKESVRYVQVIKGLSGWFVVAMVTVVARVVCSCQLVRLGGARSQYDRSQLIVFNDFHIRLDLSFWCG